MAVPTIHGTCDSRFAALRDTFVRNFSTFGETGAALSITIDNRPVVDIWAGHVDGTRTTEWQRDTIVNVYSTTKGMTAICAHILADQGRLDFDAPVAKYWPDFAHAGKGEMPVRYLLSHRAGLPAVRQTMAPEAMYQPETMASALAAQEPWWQPGAKHGYHAVTYGWLVGEVVRRITGKTIGAFFRDEVAQPLGVDCHIGLPAQHEARVAPLIPPPPPTADQLDLITEILKDPESMLAKAFINPPLPLEAVNSREWRAAEIPAANGHTNARALARVYGALACGGALNGTRVLSQAAIDNAIIEQSDGPDAVLPLYTRFGLGFMRSTPKEKMGPNPRAFGHGGMGGSMAFADPDARLGFGYVMNEMHAGLWLIDPRPATLIESLYASL
ncbi:MAG TPA: serine hydrolase domain-containing protein [Candidatus Kryptonia bacterium]|nr:serine hydrolase domain-containing protein [Candidatus Kryptonia bacterium]